MLEFEANFTQEANFAQEANFDGLIGPTHNYGGLSEGNLASKKHKGLVAKPKSAALQGLAKMKMLADYGLVQGVLPPHARPHLPSLRALGFSGTDREIIINAAQTDPYLVRNFSSASAMWAANAATISPSADCNDGKLHLSPANLLTMLHRSIEHEQTGRALRAAFGDKDKFTVHEALPAHNAFSDEGAANHVRLCKQHGVQGVEIFVYGRDGLGDAAGMKFPARQSLQSVCALARRHGLDMRRTVFARQSKRAINAGAFHNDVVCVGALSCLFYHEFAFEDKDRLKHDVIEAAQGLFEPVFVEVSEKDVPIDAAIKSYLFNSMLVQFPNNSRLSLIAPKETEENPYTKAYCDRLVLGNGPIGEVVYVDVRQSMQNGGGPACLRLRIVLSEDELAAVNKTMLMNDELYKRLCDWVKKHYRDELAPDDIFDPDLMYESFGALDELTKIMNLGDDFYFFQRN